MQDLILDYIKNEYLDEDDDDDIELDATTPLISSGIVDSFSMVSLKTFLETKFDVKLPDDEATPEAFDTVESIMALVQKHGGK
jgi:acyl carrier protein/D-alanine--poly(phosphoribitol) ligase subunit 2